MEQQPFDGLVFHVNSSNTGNFTWEMWGGRWLLDAFTEETHFRLKVQLEEIARMLSGLIRGLEHRQM